MMVGLSMVGCASSNSALAKRDALREVREAQNAPVDVNTYSSTEGVRGALWGMTQEQLIALKGEPVRRGPDFLMYDDQVDSDLVPTTYAFFEGHLAQVKSHFEVLPERTRTALVQKYGSMTAVGPSRMVADYDKFEVNEHELTAAEQWDVALILIGAVGLASLGAAHQSAGWYPLFWGQGFGERQLIRGVVRQSMINAQRPARETTWRSADTQVHLITLDSGVTDLTWSSNRLGPKFVSAQMQAAGVSDLARDL